jgi:hypothetical protein
VELFLVFTASYELGKKVRNKDTGDVYPRYYTLA